VSFFCIPLLSRTKIIYSTWAEIENKNWLVVTASYLILSKYGILFPEASYVGRFHKGAFITIFGATYVQVVYFPASYFLP
jgi:hypothetical protein